MSVPSGVRRTAQDLVAFVARDLGISPPRVRWLSLGNEADLRVARKRGRFYSVRGYEILGLYSSEATDCIFVDIHAPATTVAHEMRHYWQRVTEGDAVWKRRNEERLERDASAYASRVLDAWRRSRAACHSWRASPS